MAARRFATVGLGLLALAAQSREAAAACGDSHSCKECGENTDDCTWCEFLYTPSTGKEVSTGYGVCEATDTTGGTNCDGSSVVGTLADLYTYADGLGTTVVASQKAVAADDCGLLDRTTMADITTCTACGAADGRWCAAEILYVSPLDQSVTQAAGGVCGSGLICYLDLKEGPAGSQFTERSNPTCDAHEDCAGRMSCQECEDTTGTATCQWCHAGYEYSTGGTKEFTQLGTMGSCLNSSADCQTLNFPRLKELDVTGKTAGGDDAYMIYAVASRTNHPGVCSWQPSASSDESTRASDCSLCEEMDMQWCKTDFYVGGFQNSGTQSLELCMSSCVSRDVYQYDPAIDGEGQSCGGAASTTLAASAALVVAAAALVAAA